MNVEISEEDLLILRSVQLCSGSMLRLYTLLRYFVRPFRALYFASVTVLTTRDSE